MVADEVIFDPELIQSVLNGDKVEVSLGLKTENGADGIFNHIKYDVAQRNMQANHLAHVSKAMVEGAQIILDSNYAIQEEIIMPENTTAVENQEPSWVKKITYGFDKFFAFFEKLISTKEETKTKQKHKQSKQKKTQKH